MKTICPHCKQVYPETPDEYLGMAFECPVCHKEFICEKPKFCSECGACNPAKSLKCIQCGKSFLVMPPRPVSPPVQNNSSSSSRYTSAESSKDDCFCEEVGLFSPWNNILNFSGRSCRKECWFYVLPSTVLLVILSFFLSPDIVNYVSMGLCLVSIPLGVRRLHDMGLSGLWIIIILIFPTLWLALLFCPSQPGENRWGLNPVGVPSGKRHHWLYVVLSFVVPIVLGIIVLAAVIPAFMAVKNNGKQQACKNNMKQIEAALIIFVNDNRDKCPENLQTLLKTNENQLSETVFQCPSTGKKYVYLGNGLSVGYNTPADIPILMDAPSNHGKYINILYTGSYVQTLKLSREMTSCKEVLEELHPDLSQSLEGTIVLENARKADAEQRR